MKEDQFKIALRGLEEIFIKHNCENFWEIYEMQGFLGLSIALKFLPQDIYKEVWTYFKKNKKDLRFYYKIPEDI